jgi:DNA-binding MarR family transcriptional regulator
LANVVARRVLSNSTVHAAFFGIKRAYWGSLRTTRKQLTEMGLTAARFDLLYLLRGMPWLPVSQKTLVKKLGVTPPVVRRMLKSLRQIGLVVRERDLSDRRSWLISLTTEGRYRIRDAIDVFIRRAAAWKIVQRGLCPHMPAGPQREDAAFWLMCALEGTLDRLRKGFAARGSLYYPWHPDD